MTRNVLVVESDGGQGDAIAAICTEGSFGVDVIPHEAALAHLSKHAADYCAFIVRVAPEPSTLSAADRMGEFVLRYLAHAMPEQLTRTIVVTKLPADMRTSFPAVRHVIDDPFEAAALIEHVRACCDEPAASG